MTYDACLPQDWRLVFGPMVVYNTASIRGDTVKGVRFERLGTGRYYNVILHVGSTYVPVSDETVTELKTQTLLSPDRFLELLIQKIGYSPYLKDQIRNELKKAGDPVTQITVLQGALREL
jgi:hypothetical protein